MLVCGVCGNAGENREFVAREMMFGWRDAFRYFECGGCGCLQHAEPVGDLSRYYPPEYYAFTPQRDRAVVHWLKRARAAHALGGRSLLGRVVAWKYGVPGQLAAVRRARMRRDDAILDVGCGDGALLRDLRDAGFSRLAGIDPYLEADGEAAPGVPIARRRIDEQDGVFDWVMMHHSFEHVPDPRGTLHHVRRLLHPGGGALIRTPVAGSYAWRSYGADWVQLDPPRHLFVHTPRSLQQLAEESGFAIESVTHDSTAFQFWGSEQYRRGVPLRRAGAGEARPDRSLFSRGQLKRFARDAKALNERGDGDQACFVLRAL